MKVYEEDIEGNPVLAGECSVQLSAAQSSGGRPPDIVKTIRHLAPHHQWPDDPTVYPTVVEDTWMVGTMKDGVDCHHVIMLREGDDPCNLPGWRPFTEFDRYPATGELGKKIRVVLPPADWRRVTLDPPFVPNKFGEHE